MKITLTLISLIISFKAYSQIQFEEQIVLGAPDYNEAVDAVETSSGHYIILGNVRTVGNTYNFTLTELDQYGNTLQCKIGSTVTVFPKDISLTSTGEILVTGSYSQSTFNDYDIFLAKFTPNLDFVWLKRYGFIGAGGSGNTVFQLDNDKYVVTGITSNGGTSRPSIIYLDTAGTLLNESFLDNPNNAAKPSLKANYLGDGRFSFVNLNNITCIVDTNNTILSNPPTGIIGGYSIDSYKDLNGNTAILSATYDDTLLSYSTVFTLYDSLCNSMLLNKKYSRWANNINGVKISTENSLNPSNYVIAANSELLSNNYTSALFFKVDSAGSIIWSRKYLPANLVESKFNSFIKTSDGGYLLVGSIGLPPTNQFVVKTDSAGVSCSMTNFTIDVSSPTLISKTTHNILSGSIDTLPQLSNIFNSATNTGNLFCSAVTSLQDYNTIDISVYPNPMSDLLNIEVATQENYILKMYTATGQQILNSTFKNKFQLNTNNYAPGFYLLRIEDKNGNVQASRKLVKP
jgi:hypothetical protein